MSVYYSDSRKVWMYDFLYKKQRYQGQCRNTDNNKIKTKRDAQAFEAKLKAKIKAENNFKASSPNSWLVGEAILDYQESISDRLASKDDVNRYFREIIKYFGFDKPLEEIKKNDIEEYKKYLRKQHKKIFIKSKNAYKISDQLISDATVNANLRYLRALLIRAEELHKINKYEKVKLIGIKQKDPRPIPTEIARLILENAADHLKDIIIVATLTGMRVQEILGLLKHQVFLDKKLIRLDERTKAKEWRPVFITNHKVYEVIERLYNTTPCNHLFTYKGRPIGSIKTSWRNAQIRAGISLEAKYKFHNLRASFATIISEQTTASMHSIQKLMGHADSKVTQRYLRESDRHLMEIVENIDF